MIAAAGSSAFAEEINETTPSCLENPEGCFTVQVTDTAPLELVLENVRTVVEFETSNGFAPGTLTGKEVVIEGDFTFRL
jgi:hypothetical protein